MACTSNSTDAAFASKVPTTTKPSGTGIVFDESEGERVENALALVAFGTQSTDNTFSLRVIGWRSLGDNKNDTNGLLWIPTILAEIACTVGAAVGVAGTKITAAMRFADAMSITTGNQNVDLTVTSPGDDTIAHAVVDIKGYPIVEITFSLASGGGTDMNALVAPL